MFSPSKDKIDKVYVSLREYFKMEDDRDLNKYLGVELDRLPYVLIQLRQPYLTQSIINIISGMDKSRAKTANEVKPPLAKNERSQARKTDFN